MFVAGSFAAARVAQPPLGASGYPTRRGGRPPPTVAIDITEESRGGGPPSLQHRLIVLGNSAGSRSGGARPFGIISILFHHRFGFITVSERASLCPKTLSHYQHNDGKRFGKLAPTRVGLR